MPSIPTLLTNKAGQAHMGFVASEQTLPQSMMPPGLAAGLTVEQLNTLVDYLASMKSAK